MRKDWEIKKLGEVCEFGNGQAHEKFVDDEGEFILVNSKFISSEGEVVKRTNKQLSPLFKNDIVFVMSDVPNGKALAKCFLIDKDNSYTLNQRICVIRSGNYETKYLLYHLNRHEYLLSFNNGENQTNLRKNDILNCPLVTPPIPEQKRIVSILDQAFAAINKAKANAEQNLNNAKELFNNSVNSLFENNNGWIKSKLGEYATFRNGMNFSRSSKGETIKIVGVKDFQNNYWVPFESLETVNLDNNLKGIDALNKNDIIAVRSNGNPELIGRTLLAGDFEGKVSHSGFTIRIRLNNDELLPTYVCHYLKSQKARRSLIDSGNGVGIKSLNQGSLSNLSIAFPQSNREQKNIVSTVEELQNETKKLNEIYCRKLDDLEELKKSILHKAFNGEL